MNKTKLCECGCGIPAPIAKYTDKRWGHIKGQSIRFINGHCSKIQPKGKNAHHMMLVDMLLGVNAEYAKNMMHP